MLPEAQKRRGRQKMHLQRSRVIQSEVECLLHRPKRRRRVTGTLSLRRGPRLSWPFLFRSGPGSGIGDKLGVGRLATRVVPEQPQSTSKGCQHRVRDAAQRSLSPWAQKTILVTVEWFFFALSCLFGRHLSVSGESPHFPRPACRCLGWLNEGGVWSPLRVRTLVKKAGPPKDACAIGSGVRGSQLSVNRPQKASSPLALRSNR